MSHIVGFSISGLAGREDIYEQKLNRDENVFFGVNGSGKTSLLKILHSAMANNAGILGTVPFTSATVEIYSLNYKKIFTRTIHKREVRSAQEKGLARILKAVLATTTKSKKSKALVLDAETAYSRVKKFLARQRSASILGSLSAFEKRYKKDEKLQSVVADIDEVETRIAEALKSRDCLQSLIAKMYTGNKSVKFSDRSIQVERSDGRDIGLVSLSSGEKHLLRIFVETLLAEENSIIIDELEMSIHVDWQNKLIAAMRSLNPSAQLIVATHSPEIMADISDDKIFKL